MSKYTSKQIITKAENCKKNVETNYKLGINTKWSYYFAKQTLKLGKDINKITFKEASKPKGTHISRQIDKNAYIGLAKNLTSFVEKNKRLPNYLTYKGYQLRPRLYTYIFARILSYYSTKKKLPSKVNANSKAFTKPTVTKTTTSTSSSEYPSGVKPNSVYTYFVKKTGKKFSTIDDLLLWMKGRGYGYYYDDYYSNEQCIDRMVKKQGINCTDSLQFLINMAEAMGYEWKCIHVKCRSSGGGHVRGQFKHKKYTNGKWINRDSASVLNGNSITSLWCSDGILQGISPQWFLENLRR